MKKIIACAISSIVVAISASAGLDKQLKLPDGRILDNPMVIEKEPDGLTIAHDKGLSFVKFSNLPEDVCKEYNYHPEKAAAYEQRKQQAKAAMKQQLEQKNKTAGEIAAIQKAAEKQNLLNQINKNELRVKFLNEEIPKLEESAAAYRDKRDNIAPQTVKGGKSTNIHWRGGWFYSSSNSESARKEAKIRKQELNTVSAEYEDVKHTLDSCKRELQQKNIQLAEQKRLYSAM